MPLGNLIESLFPYKLDLYQQIDHQDDLTGALVKEWQFIETLPCSAKSIIANSARPRSGGDVQSLSNNKYAYEEYIEIRTQKKLNLRYKLANGVVIPKDYSTMAMLSSYYQFDIILYYFIPFII